MKIAASLTLLLTASLVVATLARAQRQRPKFIPPHIISATNINYPIDTLAAGMVTLNVELDDGGRVRNAQVLRPVPALSGAALVAVNRWTFSPALQDGMPEPSTITVNILFNPGYLFPRPVPLPPMVAQPGPGRETHIEFAPPQVATAQYAQYPVRSIATGPVVLDVTVHSTGSIQRVTPVLGVPSLVKPATAAVRRWTFTPAKLNDAPVDADTVVAFVFRSPTITNP
jgi:TonB family protein